MATFWELDREFRRSLAAPSAGLEAAFEEACKVKKIDWDGMDLTRAVVLRLRSYYEAQEITKRFLGKAYAAPGSDFLVETLAFYLKVAIRVVNLPLQVAAEKTVHPRRGALRPDISVWSGERLVAAIECKTQLGWNRGNWLDEFKERKRRLKQERPEADLYMFVMTGSNWPGFGGAPGVGASLFLLLKSTWPMDVDAECKDISVVEHSVERLFKAVFDRYQARQPGAIQRSRDDFPTTRDMSAPKTSRAR